VRDRTNSLFLLEAGLATLASVLFVVTLVWRDWIELVFHVDPDGGNGLLEWVIVAALLATAIGFGRLAALELRRPARAR
jgi:uncharacterized membrane protein YtjA (UPF0391 family)